MSEAVAATGIIVARGAAAAPVTITAISAANPAVVTTSAPHGLATGDRTVLSGANAVPDVNKVWNATNLTAATFSIPITVTGAGSAGSSAKLSFTDIGEITSVTPPGFSRNKLESTTHNDGAESYVLGILRQRDVAFRINYVADNPTHEDIVADIMNNVKNYWMVLFPSGVEFIGPARIQRFEFADAPTDAIQQADCALTWAGPIAMSVPA